jgi:hypothetical protein
MSVMLQCWLWRGRREFFFQNHLNAEKGDCTIFNFHSVVELSNLKLNLVVGDEEEEEDASV